MESLSAWKTFINSGRIEDYLTYRDAAKDGKSDRTEDHADERRREKAIWENPLQ